MDISKVNYLLLLLLLLLFTLLLLLLLLLVQHTFNGKQLKINNKKSY